jgi:hypothetical protein
MNHFLVVIPVNDMMNLDLFGRYAEDANVSGGIEHLVDVAYRH